jgi:tight adherence protein B
MNEPWLVYLLSFLSAALLVLFAHRYYSREYTAKREVNRRLSLIEKTGDQKQALAILRRERGIAAGDQWQRLEGLYRIFVQSGLRFRGMYFLSAVAGLSAVVTAAITLAFGFHLINFFLSLATTVVLTIMFVRMIRDRRILRFNEQLPDVVDLICRSLKAGHPLPISLSLVAREMPDPAGTEFGIASDEITYGLDLPSSLQNLSARVGDPDLMLVVMSTTIHSQTGGNLGEILARLSKLIRDRFKLRRKIHALTAEGRFSAVALTVIPLVMFGAINLFAPQYYADTWDSPVFRIAMGTGLVMLAVGNIVMRRMVKFKY